MVPQPTRAYSFDKAKQSDNLTYFASADKSDSKLYAEDCDNKSV